MSGQNFKAPSSPTVGNTMRLLSGNVTVETVRALWQSIAAKGTMLEVRQEVHEVLAPSRLIALRQKDLIISVPAVRIQGFTV